LHWGGEAAGRLSVFLLGAKGRSLLGLVALVVMTIMEGESALKVREALIQRLL
jgi:hypothetical protein